jgi:hypothetical protein
MVKMSEAGYKVENRNAIAGYERFGSYFSLRVYWRKN